MMDFLAILKNVSSKPNGTGTATCNHSYVCFLPQIAILLQSDYFVSVIRSSRQTDV